MIYRSRCSQRAVGAYRWRDTHTRFLGDAAAVAAVVFDRYRDVQPDWLPPTTGSRWLLPNRSKACRHRLRCVLHDALRAAKSRVWATTPYFVPDSLTQRLLCDAALNLIDEGGELNSVLAQIFLDDLREAEEVLAMPWGQRPWPRRVAEAIGWWARRWL